MKAKTQKNIGLVSAGIMFIVGIYQLLFRSHQFIELLGLLETTILSGIYVFALSKKKLRVAEVVYRTWWVIGVILLGIVFLGLLVSGKWAESFTAFLTVIIILLSLGLPFVLIMFLWWTGLKGLRRISETESKPKDEQKQ